MRLGLLISFAMWLGIVVWLSGCSGFYCGRMPGPGQRQVFLGEEVTNHTFGTVVESQIDPIGAVRRIRQR